MIGIHSVSESRQTIRLDMVKMAVLKLMTMNNQLYTHLYSSTFDVPEYEKENILYNNETLDLQFDQYLSEDFNNPGFKFHQRKLDVQILCNRRIRQNVREAREMYADRHNPWYSRKKFNTEEVFPDAVKRNLPKTLPMTYLCDHLLTVYHYMHDPQIAEVMNTIIAEQNTPSVTPGVQVTLPKRRPVGISGGINTEIRDKTASVEIPRPLKTVEKPQPEKTIQKPKSRPVEKPKVICASDLVGQILLQGVESSQKKLLSQWPVTSVVRDVHVRPEKTLTRPVTTSETKKPCVTNPRANTTSVAWDVNKILAPKEKRPRDFLVDTSNAQDEMEAKRQRMAQWLHNCASQPAKKVTAGIKRKASLMDKSCKDHAAKRQKMIVAKPKNALPQTLKVKKSNVNWVIK